jgi:hypothetical protein
MDLSPSAPLPSGPDDAPNYNFIITVALQDYELQDIGLEQGDERDDQDNGDACFKANRKKGPSSPTIAVAALATAMDWGEIIFPTTPPLELEATLRVGLTPIGSAALPIF